MWYIIRNLSSEYEENLYPIRSGHLVRCRKCGLYYANPRRVDFIQNVLGNNTPSTLYESKKLNHWGRMLEFNSYLMMIHQFKLPPGRVLDVGCYEGYFLYEARKYGWECYGVEPNVGGAKFATECLKLRVKQCVLEKAGFSDNYFDVVTLLAVLEHTPDPSALLKEVRRIINGAGLLVVSIPTIPFYLNLLKSKWRMFIGDHYYFFTDESMKRLMSKTGFKLLGGRYISKNVDLDTITARLSDEWLPCNLGKVGELLRKIVMRAGIGRIRFPINLFDTKIYRAKPI